MTVKYVLQLLRPPWGALPQYPRVVCTPKIHKWLVRWFTTGFK